MIAEGRICNPLEQTWRTKTNIQSPIDKNSKFQYNYDELKIREVFMYV